MGAWRDRRGTHGDGRDDRPPRWRRARSNPTSQAPRPPDSSAVPVFADDLHVRALQSSDVSFTIADPHQPDTPLIWVNDAFTRTTGYSFDEALGHNCRFLQGPLTDPAAVATLHEALRAGRPARVELVNYRKDGSTFWNEIALSPVFDRTGRLIYFVGVQDDVTAKVEARGEREELLVREKRARSAAERAARIEEAARGRVELLSAAGEVMSGTLRQAPTALHALTSVLVPGLADLAVVDLVDGGAEAHRIALTGADADQVAAFVEGEDAEGSAGAAQGLVGRVLATGQPVLIAEVGVDDLVQAATLCAVQLDAYRRLRPRSVIAVPMLAEGRTVGTLRLLTTSASERHFDRDDLSLAVELGRRAGLVLENARLYGSAHAVAETLQRSLLPAMPTAPGLSFAARYLPASDRLRVGGDWYDVLLLPDGRVGLAIGDVMGHDLPAAAAMAQFRSALRAYAWELIGPGEVLDRLDRLAQGLGIDSFATAFYAILDQDPVGGGGTLSYANAGHLPPLLSTPGNGAGPPTVRPLTEAQSLMLGVAKTGGRAEVSVPFPVGSTLLLYTDGLVEHRGQDIDEGIDRAATLFAGHSHQAAHGRADLAPSALERLADALLEEAAGDETQQDDIAVLLVALTGTAPPAHR